MLVILFYSSNKLKENKNILDFKKAFEKVIGLVDKKHENISAMYYKEDYYLSDSTIS